MPRILISAMFKAWHALERVFHIRFRCGCFDVAFAFAWCFVVRLILSLRNASMRCKTLLRCAREFCIPFLFVELRSTSCCLLVLGESASCPPFCSRGPGVCGPRRDLLILRLALRIFRCIKCFLRNLTAFEVALLVLRLLCLVPFDVRDLFVVWIPWCSALCTTSELSPVGGVRSGVVPAVR